MQPGAMVATYVYCGGDVPKPRDERGRLTLGLYDGAAPSDRQPVEIVVESLTFAP